MAKDGVAKDGMVVLAQIGAPHGVRGEVRLKVFAEDAAALKGRSLTLPDGSDLRIEAIRALKGEMHVARLAGIADRDAAERLRLKLLSMPRASLPALDEDDFYIADLVGLEVRDEAGAAIGSVLAVHDFGAGDILEVRHALAPDEEVGRDRLYAFTRARVPEVRVAEGWLALAPDEAPDEPDGP